MYSSTSTTANKIKVGDITIENSSGNSNSQNYYIDRLNKARARYVDKIDKFKKGFYRVKWPEYLNIFHNVTEYINSRRF